MLCNRELCALADFGRAKREDNVVLGDPGVNEVPRDAVFSAVALNPDFSLANVHMHKTAMHSPYPFPSNQHQQIVIPLSVEDRLNLDISIGIGNLGIVRENPF